MIKVSSIRNQTISQVYKHTFAKVIATGLLCILIDIVNCLIRICIVIDIVNCLIRVCILIDIVNCLIRVCILIDIRQFVTYPGNTFTYNKG